MSKKEILIKWKTVETITPDFPDGAIFIKEDTSIDVPFGYCSFSIGGTCEWNEKATRESQVNSGCS